MQHYKYIILIIDSDSDPIYASFREIIRKYMNTYPNDIKTFFIRSSPHVVGPTLDDDTLYTQGIESFVPGIICKSIESMRYCLQNYSFDFLIRTNMSSFWNYHYLLEKYITLPRNNYVCAVIGEYDNILYPSGCGFIMSYDVVIKCVDHSHMIDMYSYIDDILIGKLLKLQNISIIPGDRYNFTFPSNISITNKNIIDSNPSSHYHYRVKGEHTKEGDVHVHQLLYDAIYKPNA